MLTLNIIADTLYEKTDAGFIYLNKLLSASQQAELSCELWLDKRVAKLFSSQWLVHPYFNRYWHYVQKWHLYRRLLKQGQPLFLPRANFADMVLLSKLLTKQTSAVPVFLHVQPLELTAKQLRTLAGIATRHSDWVIMVPQQALLSLFLKAGFKHCQYVPMSSEAIEESFMPSMTQSFAKVVYMGSATQEKGFAQVVNLIAYMQQKHDLMPLALQTAASKHGHYDQDTQQALQKLTKLKHPYLQIYTQKLAEAVYRRLFRGSIVLLAYEPTGFSKRVSGVLLDALYAGAPVVTIANTTMADIVKQFSAGVVVENREPKTLYGALKQIQADYAYYQENALHAREALWQAYKPEAILQLFDKYALRR